MWMSRIIRLAGFALIVIYSHPLVALGCFLVIAGYDVSVVTRVNQHIKNLRDDMFDRIDSLEWKD